MITIQVHKEQI